ncbi:MAG: response regulator [Geminicoccaceae bacterium]
MKRHLLDHDERRRSLTDGGPLRVLVVEDEPAIALELRDMLLRLGHDVCGLAVDTAEAIGLASEHAPDLVLMDITLRRGDDGITAAAAIKAAMPVQVVFATAYGYDPAIRARMAATGASAVLVKPILLRELRETLAAIQIEPAD